jgi:hypothetical protein
VKVGVTEGVWLEVAVRDGVSVRLGVLLSVAVRVAE